MTMIKIGPTAWGYYMRNGEALLEYAATICSHGDLFVISGRGPHFLTATIIITINPGNPAIKIIHELQEGKSPQIAQINSD